MSDEEKAADRWENEGGHGRKRIYRKTYEPEDAKSSNDMAMAIRTIDLVADDFG